LVKDRENPESLITLIRTNIIKKTDLYTEFQKVREMKARIKDDDQYLFIQWLLLYNRLKGRDYLFILEKKSLSAKRIMFDCNRLAKKYFNLSGLSISIDNQFATMLDTVGEEFTLYNSKSIYG
jgi:oligopeptidase B